MFFLGKNNLSAKGVFWVKNGFLKKNNFLPKKIISKSFLGEFFVGEQFFLCESCFLGEKMILKDFFFLCVTFWPFTWPLKVTSTIRSVYATCHCPSNPYTKFQQCRPSNEWGDSGTMTYKKYWPFDLWDDPWRSHAESESLMQLGIPQATHIPSFNSVDPLTNEEIAEQDLWRTDGQTDRQTDRRNRLP